MFLSDIHASATSASSRGDAPAGRGELLASMDEWVAHRWIRPLDAVFARFLWNEVPDAPALAILGALLASHQLAHGHACLDLGAVLEDPELTLALPPEGAGQPASGVPLRSPAALLAQVSLPRWQAALDVPGLVGDGPGGTPLVLVDQRLYLRRCWQYEQDINAGIAARLARNPELQAALPSAGLRAMLDVLFPAEGATAGADWQKIACAAAARSAFTIITGGPGTGKTTTVVKLLAVLQALALQGVETGAATAAAAVARPLRIRLAAPTGKAAARLSESIAGAVSRLPLAELPAGAALRQAIPTGVSTLHRLLGSRPGSRKFRHDADHPLPLDVLVVDEASMIDLETMAALLQALPPRGRLVLLGDKDQLASVEAGAVLADLCRDAQGGRYTPATRDWLEQVSGQRVADDLIDARGTALDQAIVMLRHSHRFASDSGIGRLAAAINAGNRQQVARFWRQPHAGVTRLAGGECDRDFAALVLDGQALTELELALDAGTGADALDRHGPHGYARYLRLMRARRPAPGAGQEDLDDWARQVLAAHGAFQLLTTLRHGNWGVEGLNRRVARLLRDRGLIDATEGWYAGRPVLVTRNDYALGLMNGDIGITLALPAAPDSAPVLRVAFPMTDGSGRIKWVLPSRLQAVETVYALTVHKSQGSEFDHAAVVLPERLSPILTRELLYTGITRARAFLTLLSPGGDHVLEQGIARQVRRASGLLA
ncbi:exodeoxyribonuclease V subunit alpha [Bordetella genomosp. 8]|uniref:RecBCD enzyme subunit RecD n=1 Tax=Bordetella genomosp. 8 TaxID=1416806 RepID=A0A1W6YF28_9BORD|nr:exodeoxyribonuclease V subunit alpha [Bordetella genomosp. 8]ARP79642.1 exodeoxyribonuclease V subunit alpha [Bordetella genomosp. 8]